MKSLGLISRCSSIIVVLILLFSYIKTANTEQPESIKNQSQGVVVFQLKKDSLEKKGSTFFDQYTNIKWYLAFKIFVNQKYYTMHYENIIAGEDYKVIIPTGTVKIIYSLSSGNGYAVTYFTGRKNDSKCYEEHDEIEKDLTLNIKENQAVYLKIIDIGKQQLNCSWSQAGWLGRFPSPARFQEVALEVEKVEEVISKDLNGN